MAKCSVESNSKLKMTVFRHYRWFPLVTLTMGQGHQNCYGQIKPSSIYGSLRTLSQELSFLWACLSTSWVEGIKIKSQCWKILLENSALLLWYYFFFLTFHNYIVSMGFLPWEIRVAFPGESRLRQSRATQPTVHVGYFSVSIIHRTLTWTTGSLTCTQM